MVEQSDSTNVQTVDPAVDWEACTKRLAKITHLAAWIIDYTTDARRNMVKRNDAAWLVNLHRRTSEAAVEAAHMMELLTAVHPNTNQLSATPDPCWNPSTSKSLSKIPC